LLVIYPSITGGIIPLSGFLIALPNNPVLPSIAFTYISGPYTLQRPLILSLSDKPTGPSNSVSPL
jgi:hypothetical protein